MTKSHSIDYCKEVAKMMGGLCLSDEYVNIRQNLLWQCKYEHRWLTSLKTIKSGSWCPKCAINYKKINIDKLKDLAFSKGGSLVSDLYKNSKTKVEWECAEKHRWFASWSNINKGKWCPHCSNNAKLNINKVKILAELKGGQLLSNKYVNAHNKLIWMCFYRHRWEASYASIKRGRWCPKCSMSISERVCRRYFEILFNDTFPSSWPKWLINDDGNRMQLDGFCEKLNIAFEHNGSQHYVKPSFYSKKQFVKRKLDDLQKIKLCKERGISLFVIRELFSKTKIKDLKLEIKKQCLYFNLFPDFKLIETVNINDLYYKE